MNGDPIDSPSDVPNLPPETGNKPVRQDPVLAWIKRLLWCNPFYLASAALLLFGISKLTLSPDFRSETGQMFFNFGALQAYEVLLIVTAIALSRRRVWYDATLLVFLENLFLLVPFILVSQAAFINATSAALLSGAGLLLALSRTVSLRLFFPRLHYPTRLVWLGMAFLVVNIVGPLVFRHFHLDRPGSAESLSLHGWFWVLPSLVLLVNALPRPRHRGGNSHERAWLPMGLAAIWIAATAFHLFRLGYIYDLEWNDALPTPLLWVATWTLVRRLTDFLPSPAENVRRAAFCAPCGVTALALLYTDSTMLFTLSLLNALVYGALYLRDRTNRFAFHLALLSLTFAVAATPHGFLLPRPFTLDRGDCVLFAGGGYAVVQAMLSRHAIAGVLAGVAVGLGTLRLLQGDPEMVHFALQSGLVFALLHSLRWADKEDLVLGPFRVIVAIGWVIHSFVWINQSWSETPGLEFDRHGWVSVSYGVLLLGGYLLAWAFSDERPPLILPIAALLVFAIIPSRAAYEILRAASAGLLAIAASLLLFAIGTLLAWTKHRWHNGAGHDPTHVTGG